MGALDIILTKVLPALVTLVAGLGWFLERRKRKAEASKVEAEARSIDSDTFVRREAADFSHASTMLDKAEKLADKLIGLNADLMECHKQKSAVDIRVGELEAEKRHIEDTLKAEIRKSESKEQEIVRLTELKHALEDRLK